MLEKWPKYVSSFIKNKQINFKGIISCCFDFLFSFLFQKREILGVNNESLYIQIPSILVFSTKKIEEIG